MVGWTIRLSGSVMRLINTTTLTIEEFKSKHPPYAILSHTWGAEEVTFEEYTQP